MAKHEYVTARREDVRPIPEAIVPFVRRMTKFFTRLNVAVYKASGGRLMGRFQGVPICLVTMIGAKSGQVREVPLMHVPIDDKKILVASQAGLEMHPIDDADRTAYLKDHGGIGYCNITKCCTEVCPEHIKITDNAIIPLKERVADRYYDPIRMVWRKLTGASD